MEKLIVLASLGRVRPLKFQKTDDDPLRPPHLVECSRHVTEIKHENRSAVATDQAGRFAQGDSASLQTGMSYGEEHNLETELENQALRRVADKIASTVTEAGNPAWRLVAPQEIARSLQQALPAAVRNSLARTEAGDLTKLPLMELEKRLLNSH